MQVDDSFGPATGKLFSDVVTSEQVIAERFAINQGGPPVKVEAKNSIQWCRCYRSFWVQWKS